MGGIKAIKSSFSRFPYVDHYENMGNIKTLIPIEVQYFFYWQQSELYS